MNFVVWGRKIARRREITLKIGLPLLLLVPNLAAQERKIDPTWLYRRLPEAKESVATFVTDSCRYKPLFGEGDSEARILQSVSRFGQIEIAAHGSCQPQVYAREEEIYFVLSGRGLLHYGDGSHGMRQSDFTYLPPGVQHSISNDSGEPLQVLAMSFKTPAKIAINTPSQQPKIVNLDDVKEETVGGHPSSVLYKLLIGPRNGKRDALDEAYVVTSVFWMNSPPGGTNFPYHHEAGEEICLFLDGSAQAPGGGGRGGVGGRIPGKAGEAD